MPLYGYDWTIIIVIPAVIFSMYAQYKVSSSFAKYSKIPNTKGYTGADVARQLLSLSGINDVEVTHVAGNLTDHFDPTKNVIRLSDSVYGKSSIAAISVAAHETGHAIQHAHNYAPLKIRSGVFPFASLGTSIAPYLILIGLLFSFLSTFGTMILYIGIGLFLFYVLFSFVTLPVEFNASNRAIKLLEENNFITSGEESASKEVLRAAALTYVAAALAALLNLFRYIALASRRNND